MRWRRIGLSTSIDGMPPVGGGDGGWTGAQAKVEPVTGVGSDITCTDE